MKRVFLYCMMIAAVLTACKNGVNEPNDTVVKDGKATFTIAAPCISSNSSSSARKISGEISDGIVFYWWEGDEIDFEFFDDADQSLGEATHVVSAGDFNEDGSINVSVTIPEGTAKFNAASGPEDIPTLQVHEVNGISNNMMRFEKNGCLLTEESFVMDPIWTALIIQPTYTFNFNTGIAKSSCTCYVGFDEIEVKQTIGSTVNTFHYCNGEDEHGDMIPITKSANEGSSPVTKYVIVVEPTSACDLSFEIKYNTVLFTGTGTKSSPKTPINLVPTENVSTIAMHTEGQAVKNLVAGQAYNIESIKDHPLAVTWKIKD